MPMDVSHIWVGRFGPEAPATYFVQQAADDDSPRSQFGADQGERWFDHDWVEISFLDEPQSVRTLVDGHSYSASYLDAVVARAADLGVTEANVFVLADEEQFSDPRSVAGPGYQLWYLGTYRCDT